MREVTGEQCETKAALCATDTVYTVYCTCVDSIYCYDIFGYIRTSSFHSFELIKIIWMKWPNYSSRILYKSHGTTNKGKSQESASKN